MDYQAVLDYFNRRDGTKHTVADQLKWLIQKRGHSPEVAQEALATVYFAISEGQKFEADKDHSGADYMSIEMDAIARGLEAKQFEVLAKHSGDRLQKAVEEAIERMRPVATAPIERETVAEEKEELQPPTGKSFLARLWAKLCEPI